MRRRGERGVTLLELLIAIFLMSTALLGIAAAFPYAMYGVTGGGFQTQATLMGEQCLDVSRQMSFGSLTAASLEAACPPMTGGFTRNITVAQVSSLMTITVVINFPEPTGINATTLVTHRSQ